MLLDIAPSIQESHPRMAAFWGEIHPVASFEATEVTLGLLLRTLQPVEKLGPHSSTSPNSLAVLTSSQSSSHMTNIEPKTDANKALDIEPTSTDLSIK